MILKPQDVVILLKLVVWNVSDWSYALLAQEIFMSSSEVHAGIQRAIAARLIDESRRMPVISALNEFLIHGIKYVYLPSRGSLTRGMPTGYAAPPLNEHFSYTEDIPVWPDPEGEARGYEFSPLYKTVPAAAKKDKAFYELLALVDAIRGGRVRERTLAIQELEERINNRKRAT